jgi:uncharacterized membrane protein YhdT
MILKIVTVLFLVAALLVAIFDDDKQSMIDFSQFFILGCILINQK